MQTCTCCPMRPGDLLLKFFFHTNVQSGSSFKYTFCLSDFAVSTNHNYTVRGREAYICRSLQSWELESFCKDMQFEKQNIKYNIDRKKERESVCVFKFSELFCYINFPVFLAILYYFHLFLLHFVTFSSLRQWSVFSHFYLY